MSECFPKSKLLGGNVKIELDLSSYTTKTDLKDVTSADKSKLAKKVDLAIWNSNIDINKLGTTPVDFSKLSDVVKNDVVKGTVYNKLVLKSFKTNLFKFGKLKKKLLIMISIS